MVALGDRDLGDAVDGRGGCAVEHQRDRAGGIRLKCEAGKVIHHLDFGHVGAGAGRIDGHGDVDDRFWLGLPALRHLQAMLQVAHAGKVLVEALTVVRSEGTLQAPGLLGDGVEDALAGVEFQNLRVDLGLRTLEKKLLEHVGRLVLGRNRHAGAGAREAPVARVDGERERGKPRHDPDPLRDDLVEGDGVVKRTAAGMRRGGEEADVRRMAAVDRRMRHAAEDREVIAVGLEVLEIVRGDIGAALAGREELLREHAEVVADGEHAARNRSGRERRGSRGRPREAWQHRVEERQGERNARALEETAARNGLADPDEGAVVARRGGAAGWELSFVEEEVALDDLVDDPPDAVVVGAGAFQDPLDRRPVGEADRGARGVDRSAGGRHCARSGSHRSGGAA